MLKFSNLSRRITLSNVVQTMTTYGPISRASVAKMTGLSKQTVSEIVAVLEQDGWVQTVGQTEGDIGRRAAIYEIAPEAAFVASVDLGGSKVRVALCNLAGAIATECTEPTTQAGGEEVVAQVARLIIEAATHSGLPTNKIFVAVVGVPGVLEPSTGNIKLAPNINGIDKVDFPCLLRDQLGIDVLVDNDVNLAALGEYWVTHQHENDDLVYLSIGTGIGAGLVIGGELVRGATGAAGEVGYIPFGANYHESKSKKIGSLERMTATHAMIDLYEQLTGTKKTVPEIFEANLTGDCLATSVLETTARRIAHTIAIIVAVVDPACVVMGGSIGVRQELIDLIKLELTRCSSRNILVEASVLGNHATLIGGTSIALSHLHMAVFTGGLPGTKIVVPPPQCKTYQRSVI